jgi:hypothetical protein
MESQMFSLDMENCENLSLLKIMDGLELVQREKVPTL